MKLGLGLGLSAAQRQSNYAAITADWMNWGGSNDGAVTNLVTTGGVGPLDIVSVSDSEAILFWNTAESEGMCVVLDVDSDLTFKAEITNAPLTLSISNPGGANIVKLSDTKFVALAEDNTTGALECSLISKSGKTLSELDNDVIAVTVEATFRNGLSPLNSTQAVFIGKESSDGDDGRIGVIDVAGDTIAIGALVDMNQEISDYPSICRLTDSSFVVVSQQSVFYCTVLGTTITVEDSIDIDASSTIYDDVMVGRVDDNTVLVSYERSGDGEVDVNSFSWGGASLSRGAPQTGIFDGNDIFQGVGTVTALGDRCVMFSGRQDNEAVRFSAAVICRLDDVGNITVGDVVQTSATVRADYAVIDATPNNLYVFAAYRDGTSTPNYQIGTRILKGF